MGYDTLVSVKKSKTPGKDYTAFFKDSKTGKTHKQDFGDGNMDHYNIHKDKERRRRYRIRHKKDLDTNDPTRAGYLSYYLLWGESTSLRTNLAAYRKRFFSKSVKSSPIKKTSPTRKKTSPTRKKTSPIRKSMKSPKKSSENGGLKRWFDEKWVDIKTGKPCGRQKGEDRDYPACRPSKRISDKTPKTSGELTPAEKARFKKVKKDSTKIPYQHRRKSPSKKMNTPLCPRGKKAAMEKFDVYPSAYANAYASKICSGRIKDPSGLRRKDWGPKTKKK